MKRGLLIVALLGAGCVTSRDLQDVSLALDRIERTVQDDEATGEDVKRAIEEAKADIAEVQERVAERTSEVVEDSKNLLEEGGLSALITALGMALLHTYRNSTRRRDLEAVRKQESKT